MAKKNFVLTGLGFGAVGLLVGLVLFVAPVLAAGMINSPVVPISYRVTGGDIEASSTYLAVTYHSVAGSGGQGIVYVKSATLADGWLTSTPLGFGAQTSLTMDPNNAAVAYVAWVDSSGLQDRVRAARCQLAPTASPSCTITNVFQAQFNSDKFQATDIVVSGDGSIHVAWENGETHRIFTARATTAAPASWTTTQIVPPAGNQDSRPALAWSNNGGTYYLHLAFLRAITGQQPRTIFYRRDVASDGYHNWSASPGTSFTFNPADSYVSTRPAMIAGGSRVVLSWDAYSPAATGVDPKGHYALMRVESANYGGTSWGDVLLITSNVNGLLATGANYDKYSAKSGPPQEQIGLRPNLSFSGPGYAVVWQASPDESGCSQFGASTANEIYYSAYNFGTGAWSAPATLTDNKGSGLPTSQYSYNIAADLAVVSSGSLATTPGHFLFMRDPSTTLCGGGNYQEYTLYYWGPVQKRDLDQGDGGKVFLPVINKNSSS